MHNQGKRSLQFHRTRESELGQEGPGYGPGQKNLEDLRTYVLYWVSLDSWTMLCILELLVASQDYHTCDEIFHSHVSYF